jgi:ribosomal protein S18 acetylase RimI-like enzyme
MDIKIRKAKKDDFVDILRLNRNIYKETRADPDFGDSVFLKRPSRARMVRWFNELLSEANNVNAIYLVAELDGKVVGHCFVKRERPGSELSHVGVLSMLVDRDYRGIGVGGRLLREMIKSSRKKFETIYLRVFSSNVRAKGLYKKMGFRSFGIGPRFVKRGRKYFDMEYMYLRL